MGIGMPAGIALDRFGYLISSIFGTHPYHVGSSLGGKEAKNWRDVDVRLILDDARYAEMGFGNPEDPHNSERWCIIAEHMSWMGREITGLPIDFQIQQQTHANANFKGMRSALGCRYQLRVRNGPA